MNVNIRIQSNSTAQAGRHRRHLHLSLGRRDDPAVSLGSIGMNTLNQNASSASSGASSVGGTSPSDGERLAPPPAVGVGGGPSDIDAGGLRLGLPSSTDCSHAVVEDDGAMMKKKVITVAPQRAAPQHPSTSCSSSSRSSSSPSSSQPSSSSSGDRPSPVDDAAAAATSDRRHRRRLPVSLLKKRRLREDYGGREDANRRQAQEGSGGGNGCDDGAEAEPKVSRAHSGQLPAHTTAAVVREEEQTKEGVSSPASSAPVAASAIALGDNPPIAPTVATAASSEATIARDAGANPARVSATREDQDGALQTLTAKRRRTNEREAVAAVRLGLGFGGGAQSVRDRLAAEELSRRDSLHGLPPTATDGVVATGDPRSRLQQLLLRQRILQRQVSLLEEQHLQQHQHAARRSTMPHATAHIPEENDPLLQLQDRQRHQHQQLVAAARRSTMPHSTLPPEQQGQGPQRRQQQQQEEFTAGRRSTMPHSALTPEQQQQDPQQFADPRRASMPLTATGHHHQPQPRSSGVPPSLERALRERQSCAATALALAEHHRRNSLLAAAAASASGGAGTRVGGAGVPSAPHTSPVEQQCLLPLQDTSSAASPPNTALLLRQQHQECLRREEEILSAMTDQQRRRDEEQARMRELRVQMEVTGQQQQQQVPQPPQEAQQIAQRRQTMPHGGASSSAPSSSGTVPLQLSSSVAAAPHARDRSFSLPHGGRSFHWAGSGVLPGAVGGVLPRQASLPGDGGPLEIPSASASATPPTAAVDFDGTAAAVVAAGGEQGHLRDGGNGGEGVVPPPPIVAAATSATTATSSHPMEGITSPGPNDVLLGRGHFANNHQGNRRFRSLLHAYRPRYVAAYKAKKPAVSREVVAFWRELDPPGRFLECTYRPSGKGFDGAIWCDVGDKRAQEKTSQCLREKSTYAE